MAISKRSNAGQIVIGLMLAFVVVALFSACSMPADEGLKRAVLDADPGDGMAILDQADIDGDRLCVVGPYTARERFADVTGVDWPQIDNTGIPMSDLIDLVAVIDDGEVVAWAEIERDVAPRAVGVEDGCIP